MVAASDDAPEALRAEAERLASRELSDAMYDELA